MKSTNSNIPEQVEHSLSLTFTRTKILRENGAQRWDRDKGSQTCAWTVVELCNFDVTVSVPFSGRLCFALITRRVGSSCGTTAERTRASRHA